MIAILKYPAGNIRSVQNAVTRLGHNSIVTNSKNEIRKAEKVILPGVGEASSAMEYLRDQALDQLIVSLQQPVLGICLGLQLLCKTSEEGPTECLGVFDAVVKRFPATNLVPQTGWNSFEWLKNDLFKGIKSDNDVYYVHSYYASLSVNTIAVCQYSVPFSAALQKDNFYATQFHPEKSAQVGEVILKNFLDL